MPTYEYRCNACKKEFEYQQRMADPDLVKCEACGEDKLEKLISWSAFQLKGSGWYKDLYSSNPKEAVKQGLDKGAPPKAESGDAKPAAAADTSATAKPAASESSSSTPAASTPSTSSGSGTASKE
ncbi:hypothetical protein BH11MYX3_BH11MYX3_36210 [soil metagenome]